MATTSSLTERKVAEMLTENTGTHFLDSGGAHGRGWQQRAGMRPEDFAAQPMARWSDDHRNVEASAFHQLVQTTEYSPDWQRRLTRFANSQDAQRLSWWDICTEFARLHHDPRSGWPIEHRNSAEFDNALDEVLAWTQFVSRDGDAVALVRSHNGADLRGGYSTPKAFVLDDADYSLSDTSIMVHCPGCDLRWTDTDGTGGYSWTTSDAYGEELDDPALELDLEECVVDLDDDTSETRCPRCSTALVVIDDIRR